MKINELFEAASQDEKNKIEREFLKFYNALDNWSVPIADKDLEMIKAAVKILGRSHKVYSGGWKPQTLGNLYDRFVSERSKQDAEAGKDVAFPTGQEATAKAFTERLVSALAKHKPIIQNYFGRVWTISSGGKYRDPQNGMRFRTEQQFEDAWEEISKRGKKVHVRLPLASAPATLIQLGKYLLMRSTSVRGAFSNEPTTEYHIKVQTTSILKNAVNKKVELTDQQVSALQDIAATKNKNAIEGLKAMMAVLQTKDNVKKVIDDSEKLATATKKKLQAIVDGAKDFKED
jgi:hypothetical protein